MLITLWEDACFFVCVCVRNLRDACMSLCRVCAPVCVHMQRCCTWVWMTWSWLHASERVRVCQVCCGGGLCNVNKQQQQQQQLRWLPLSLSYVVIRSGWKCGTTVPLTVTQHFSQAEDYRQKLAGLLSPLRATCHHSSGHWSWSSPPPPAI